MPPIAIPRILTIYEAASGERPFVTWLETESIDVRARIRVRLDRVAEGNLGLTNNVGEGVIELKENKKGPGYRVYIGQWGKESVVLLVGGTKSSQKKDIQNALSYWAEYKGQQHGKAKR